MKQNIQNVLILVFILFVYNISMLAQVGINTTIPKSTLDVTSQGTQTTEVAGIQAPRLTLAELTVKGNSLYGVAQTGAIIYITDISGGGNAGQRANITAPGCYYFDGSVWQNLTKAKPITKEGDITQAFKDSDYDGWYLLDGRDVSSLPAKARTAATNLGFTSKLPDARDRVLKMKSTTEALAATGGTSTKTISTANLPNVSLTGSISATLASAGAHTHTASGTLAAGGGHTHIINGILADGGAHTHTVSGSLAAGGGHTHGASGTLASAGAHTHNFSTIYTMPAGAKDVDRGTRAGSAWAYLGTTNYTTTSAGNHSHTLSATLAAGGGHTHPINGSLAAADAHTHGVTGSLASDDAHTHAVTASLASNGAHTHAVSGNVTLPLGGTQAPLSNRSAYLVVNTFIYLGL
jgi:hypothetical protein